MVTRGGSVCFKLGGVSITYSRCLGGGGGGGGGVEAASGSQGGLHDMVVVCKQLVMGGGYFGIQCSGEEMVKCCLGFLAR